jgi:hypothetical protein
MPSGGAVSSLWYFWAPADVVARFQLVKCQMILDFAQRFYGGKIAGAHQYLKKLVNSVIAIIDHGRIRFAA